MLAGIDCHTMAAVGPAGGPDPSRARPWVCLGSAQGRLAEVWTAKLVRAFQTHFADQVTVGRPFAGGWITRSHGHEIPWVQVELSRAPFASNEEKGKAIAAALRDWIRALGWAL